MAFAAAAGGRPGPAVLLCPHDLLRRADRTVRSGRAPVSAPIRSTACVADPAQVAMRRPSSSRRRERPLVVAGGGVHLLGRDAELARAAGALQPAGRDHDAWARARSTRRHPLSLGVIGYFMGHAVRTAAPCARLVERRRRHPASSAPAPTRTAPIRWTLFPRGARFIHLDIDGAEIGRNYEALRLVGDAQAHARRADRAPCRARDLDEAARRRGRRWSAASPRARVARRRKPRRCSDPSAAPIRPSG